MPLQPHCIRNRAATVNRRPRWATLTACVSNQPSWPCSPKRWRSRSKPCRPAAPPTERSSGSSSTATMPSSAPSTAPLPAGTARPWRTPRSPSTPAGRRSAPGPSRPPIPTPSGARARRSRRKYAGRRRDPLDAQARDLRHHPSPGPELTAMYFDEFKHQLPDIDPAETEDWMTSLDQVVAQEGEIRARFLVYKLLKRARQLQIGLPPLTQTRYINTISPEQEPSFPGDEEMERRIRRMIRWNAVAMVLRANNQFAGIGGHLATYASAATLYEVGFNHFFRGKDGDETSGDQIFYQGHAAPGIYARAFLEGRLSDDQLDHFRRETVAGRGPQLVPAPAPHARLLGVPDGLDGPRADQRDLPGALQPLPPQPRPGGHLGLARVGVPRRRRDRRARVARRAPRRRPRGPRQPDLRRQLQPAAARRPGPRQRQDHPGARGRLPRRRAGTSSRSSGAASGTSSSPATSTACSSSR